MNHLTEHVQCDEVNEDRLRHLERDRWPEFERELRLRRPRKVHFSVAQYRVGERPRWEWMVTRCRTWTEVEQVLNRHRVDWKREHGEIVVDGANVYRCR
jgi:hypothetical protein